MILWPPLSKHLVTTVRKKLFKQEETSRGSRLREGGHLPLLFGLRGKKKEPGETTTCSVCQMFVCNEIQLKTP